MLKPKHIILLVTLFVVTDFSVKAQYKIGVHGGMGSSTYTGKDVPEVNKPKWGLTGGMYFEREINPTIAIGAELNYEEKGTSFNFYTKDATNISVDSRLKYISLPVILKAYLGYNAYFYFYGGLSANYLANELQTVSVTEYGYEISSEPYFNYEFRKMDAAILAGFGINFRELIFDIRYQRGLYDVYKGTNPPNMRNQYISATLGYSIYKKKIQYCFNPRRRI